MKYSAPFSSSPLSALVVALSILGNSGMSMAADNGKMAGKMEEEVPEPPTPTRAPSPINGEEDFRRTSLRAYKDFKDLMGEILEIEEAPSKAYEKAILRRIHCIPALGQISQELKSFSRLVKRKFLLLSDEDEEQVTTQYAIDRIERMNKPIKSLGQTIKRVLIEIAEIDQTYTHLKQEYTRLKQERKKHEGRLTESETGQQKTERMREEIKSLHEEEKSMHEAAEGLREAAEGLREALEKEHNLASETPQWQRQKMLRLLGKVERESLETIQTKHQEIKRELEKEERQIEISEIIRKNTERMSKALQNRINDIEQCFKAIEEHRAELKEAAEQRSGEVKSFNQKLHKERDTGTARKKKKKGKKARAKKSRGRINRDINREQLSANIHKTNNLIKSADARDQLHDELKEE